VVVLRSSLAATLCPHFVQYAWFLAPCYWLPASSQRGVQKPSFFEPLRAFPAKNCMSSCATSSDSREFFTTVLAKLHHPTCFPVFPASPQRPDEAVFRLPARHFDKSSQKPPLPLRAFDHLPGIPPCFSWRVRPRCRRGHGGRPTAGTAEVPPVPPLAGFGVPCASHVAPVRAPAARHTIATPLPANSRAGRFTFY
jgi:hypothetical protein